MIPKGAARLVASLFWFLPFCHSGRTCVCADPGGSLGYTSPQRLQYSVLPSTRPASPLLSHTAFLSPVLPFFCIWCFHASLRLGPSPMGGWAWCLQGLCLWLWLCHSLCDQVLIYEMGTITPPSWASLLVWTLRIFSASPFPLLPRGLPTAAHPWPTGCL